MGMWDKDKEFGNNLTTWIGRDERFIIWAAKLVPIEPTEQYGTTEQAVLLVSRMDAPNGEREEVTTLAGPIREKVGLAEPDDFPAIVCWTEVKSSHGGQATVLRFVGEYQPPAGSAPSPNAPLPANDDIPF